MKNITRRAVYESDPIRFESMKEFGHCVTESSGHFSEYVSCFRKRKDLLRKCCRKGFGGGKLEIPLKRGHEYASDIVEAHVFDWRKIS